MALIIFSGNATLGSFGKRTSAFDKDLPLYYYGQNTENQTRPTCSSRATLGPRHSLMLPAEIYETNKLIFNFPLPLRSNNFNAKQSLTLCTLRIKLTLILRRSRTGTVWFYISTSNKRAARPKLYTKSLTRVLKRMYSRFTLVRISINL